jgi:hypothetical protein
MVAWLVEATTGDSIFSTLLRTSKYSSVREFNDFAEQKAIYTELFYKEVPTYFNVYLLRTAL